MNIPAYLRKLDDEIREHRQHIALHQVEIARLEDARRVMIGLAEKDEAKANGTAALPASEKPLLIMREARTAPPADGGDGYPAYQPGKRRPPAATEAERIARRKERDRERHRRLRDEKKAAKARAPYPTLTDAQRAERGARFRVATSGSGSMRERIVSLMQANPDRALRVTDLRVHFRPTSDYEEKSISNAVYQLRLKGVIEATEEVRSGRAPAYRLVDV